KLLVTGAFTASSNDLAVARYTADGVLDVTFSDDGFATFDLFGSTDSGYRLVVQTDGKIVVAGSSLVSSLTNLMVARLNADGTLDTTFSDDGVFVSTFGTGSTIVNGLAIQSDGRIVVGGYAAFT